MLIQSCTNYVYYTTTVAVMSPWQVSFTGVRLWCRLTEHVEWGIASGMWIGPKVIQGPPLLPFFDIAHPLLPLTKDLNRPFQASIAHM